MTGKYRVTVNVSIQQLFQNEREDWYPIGAGLMTSVTHDFDQLTLRDAADIMLKYHDTAQAILEVKQ